MSHRENAGTLRARIVMLSLIALGLSASPFECAIAQNASGDASPGSDRDVPSVAYRVVIDAPSALKDTLQGELAIIRWQTYDEMNAELLERLANEAVEEARGVVAAEGFFSAAIDVEIDHGAKPATVTLKVVPGEPTRISKVDIEVTGPAASDAPRGTEAIAKLKYDWSLREGDVFRQSAWSAAKSRAVSTLTASPYASAKLEKSEASIDPEQRSANLAVELTSGPPFTFAHSR
jgi:translocation and assembly module TamA